MLQVKHSKFQYTPGNHNSTHQVYRRPVRKLVTGCVILTFSSVGQYESVRTVQELPKGMCLCEVLVRSELYVDNFFEQCVVHLTVLLWTQARNQTHKVRLSPVSSDCIA